MKSTTVAYLLWFFLGLLGAHKFYLGKTGMGILYFFTAGLFGIGWFIDVFSLGTQVDLYNSIYARGNNNTNTNVNNVVIPQTQPQTNVSEQIHKLAELKQKGYISDEEYETQKRKILS